MTISPFSFSNDPLEETHQISSRPEVGQQLSILLSTIRRHLHMHPEIGFQEYETALFIREMLEMHGLEVKGPLAETGLYTDIVGETEGPAIGFRADIDALPIEDEKTCRYRSCKEGVAHLCGHDAHTAIAIGVALLLNQVKRHLKGRVRVFFQPNEEGLPSGAAAMIEAGVLNGLQAVYSVHVDPTLAAGKFGLREGPITAASDQFRVCIHGHSTGHSARPHVGVDTVWVAFQIVNALYQLIGRVTDARNASVLTITRLKGGETYNVIPSKVEFGGTLRSTDEEDRNLIKYHIKQTAEQIATLYHASVEVDVLEGSPAVVNDSGLIRIVRETAEQVFGRESIFEIPRPSMGSEDFAFYLQHIPGALVRVGTSSQAENSFALHDAAFDIDESVLAPAAQLMAHAIIEYLQAS